MEASRSGARLEISDMRFESVPVKVASFAGVPLVAAMLIGIDNTVEAHAADQAVPQCIVAGVSATVTRNSTISYIRDTSEMGDRARSITGLPAGGAEHVSLVSNDSLCVIAATAMYASFGEANPMRPVILVRVEASFTAYVVIDPERRSGEFSTGRVFNHNFTEPLGYFGI
jgi:hypothetical protein